MISRFICLVLLILSFFILLILGYNMINNASDGFILDHIEISPTDSKGIILGRKELGQKKGARSAEEKHLNVYYENNAWKISNAARNKKIDVKTKYNDRKFLKRWLIKKGDIIKLNNITIEIQEVFESKIMLKANNTADNKSKNFNKIKYMVWENGVLTPKDESKNNEFVFYKKNFNWFKNECKRWINYNIAYPLGMSKDKEIPAFSIGGSVNLPDRWSLPGIEPQAFKIIWYNKKFYISPGKSLIQFKRNQENFKRFNQLKFTLKGNEDAGRIIIGKTYYKIKLSRDKLILEPYINQDILRTKPEIPENKYFKSVFKTISWPGYGKSFFDLIKKRFYLPFIWLLIPVIVYFAGNRYYSYSIGLENENDLKKLMTVTSICFFFLVTSYFLNKDQHNINFAYLLFMAWLSNFIVSLLIMSDNNIDHIKKWLWLIFIILAGFGAVVLSQMAVGAENLRWMSFAKKHIIVLICSCWLIYFITILKKAYIWQLFSTGICGYILMVIVSILLMGQYLFGSEHGVLGIQPAEAAKFMLVVMAAIVGTNIRELRDYYPQYYKENSGKYLLDIIKILLIVGMGVFVALFGVHDLSPIIIIMIFLLSWVWKAAPHPWKATQAKLGIRIIIFFLLITIVMTAVYAFYNPDNLPYYFGQKNRILVWSNPGLYPHSGEQLLKALEFGAFGGMTGAGSWTGLNHDIMKLPAVQNDFVGSFILYKYGGIMAVFIMILQISFVAFFFVIAKNINMKIKEMEESGDYNKRRSLISLEFMISGFAWMHVLHWSIAWSNALGLLPVMGQPMTWISSANSHILFFALPALMITMLKTE